MSPDPWIGLEEDREKALRVDEATAGYDFEASVRAYWEMTPDTPPALVIRYVDHVLAARERSTEWLGMITGGEYLPAGDGTWLEIGCGTGDLMAAASERGLPVVGVDIALRWLVVARRRPELADMPLVCACAEALPFPDGAFHRVVSLGLLEHCRDPLPVTREANRVIAPGGRVDLRTVNRYTLLREPHVQIWGVGFVPRRYQDAYVRWRGGVGYRHHRPLSHAELGNALRQGGFREVRVRPARTLRAEWARMGPVARRLTPVYEAVRRTRGVARMLSCVAPLLEATGARP